MAKTPTYTCWRHMRDRCQNPKRHDYPNYGGRGIKVCERWADFINFFDDMGTRPRGMTIERIDNGGNYEPGNCRWATATEQARNRRTNVLLTIGGITMPIVSWAEKTGVPRKCIEQRIRRGFPAEVSVSRESRRGKRLVS